jgi:ubiquinone/menaquinone biosynthesis C-methylase UbiE
VHGRSREIANLASTEVEALFNGKARSWPEKYRSGGPLAHRVNQITARLALLRVPPGKVLDLGCGTGEIARAIARMGYRVTASDIADNMIQVARRKWAGTPIDWVSLTPGWVTLPFEDHSFRCIVAACVFEYLEDPESAAKEISRVLFPDGVLLFSAPNPFAKVRRAEAWLSRILAVNDLPLPFRSFPRIGAYASYLRLSRNRFRGERWRSVLTQAGLVPVDEREFAEQAWRQQANAPLILLAARKETA